METPASARRWITRRFWGLFIKVMSSLGNLVSDQRNCLAASLLEAFCSLSMVRKRLGQLPGSLSPTRGGCPKQRLPGPGAHSHWLHYGAHQILYRLLLHPRQLLRFSGSREIKVRRILDKTCLHQLADKGRPQSLDIHSSLEAKCTRPSTRPRMRFFTDTAGHSLPRQPLHPCVAGGTPVWEGKNPLTANRAWIPPA